MCCHNFKPETQTPVRSFQSKREKFFQNARGNSVASALNAIAKRVDFDPRLHQLDVPTLVIGGELDCITPPAEMRHLAHQIPDNRYCNLPGSGHLPPIEFSEICSRSNLRFCAVSPM
jgi:pimeloyl-ACP methyl ester carboxylesterase